MTGHAGQVRAVVTGAGSLEIKWPLNPPTTSRRFHYYRGVRAEEACRALSPRVDGDIPGGDEARSGGSIPSLPTHAPSGRAGSV